MLRVIIGLFFLCSCSMGGIKKGGEDAYKYEPHREYTYEELKTLAPKFITTSYRNPPVGTLEKLFPKGEAPLKRIGIVIFETQIQPTRGGLAGHDRIYLSEQGKQLLTENFHTIWNEVFKTSAPEIEYVPSSKIKKSKALHEFGSQVEDFVKSKRDFLAPDDIFYLESGKKTSIATTFNPRGMQDLSFMLAPATELMGGPKWSEHNKQFVNEVMKELKLDAVLIIMSEVSWSTGRTDKHSGESIDEAIKIKLHASTLVSLSEYRARALKSGLKDPPSITLCYRDYVTEVKFPANLAIQDFAGIAKEVIKPTLKSYTDLSIMMVNQIASDLRETH